MQSRAYFTDLGGCLFPDFLDAACDILMAQYACSPASLDQAKHELWSQYAHWPGGGRASAEDSRYAHLELQAWSEFAVRAGIDAAPEELISATTQCARPLDPSYEALLERLQSQGVVLGVISNNTRFWWQRQRDALGLGRFFPPHRVILSCDYGVSKKSPGLELFKAAIASAGVPPHACVFADDRVKNIEFALRAGLGAAILHPKNVNWGAEYVAKLLVQAGFLTASDFPEDDPRLKWTGPARTT